ALPDKEISGSVTEIAAAADAATGTYSVEISVPAGTAGISGVTSGLVGGGGVHPPAHGPGPPLPVEALLEADGSHGSVFVLPEGASRAERRTVTVGAISGDQVVVLSGLEGAARVITDGAANLRDGSPVRVLP